MKVSFKIDYQTIWGQVLYISGSASEFGEWDPSRALLLKNFVPGEWEVECEFPSGKRLEYKYLIKDGNGNIIWEGGKNRLLETGKNDFDEVRCRDFWRVRRESDTALFSSAFTKVLMRRNIENEEVNTVLQSKKTLRIQIYVPTVNPECRIGILGDQPALGNWMEDYTLLMKDAQFPLWSIDIDADKLKFPLQFKYVVYNTVKKQVVIWEQGSNRLIRDYVCKEPKSIKIHTDENFRFPVTHWRGAGVSVPLFSLRTDKSGGIGEFPDIKKLVDWAKLTGLKLVQLLPLNETVATHTWIDTYPYKSISTMALHPVYLNINKIGVLEDESLMIGFAQALAGFNALETVHYDEIHKIKSKFFKLIFDQQKELFLVDPPFLKFFDENKEWLVPYAAFCYLRDKNKTANFRKWSQFQVYNANEISLLCANDQETYPDIAVHYFIQYHAHKQLLESSEYARLNGVVLKGDIPIGISPDSVEAWMHPELFNLDQQAGAPPDEFADLGQNWGFPTYNWKKMADTNFSWWNKRLKQMSRYFDATRIDHILGFFRIWEIPVNQVQGIMGHFRPAIPFSRDEIIDSGITFNEERFTKPYIRDYFLWELFGEETEEVRLKYLTEYEPGKYNLKTEYSTQRKVWDYFDAAKKGEELSGKKTRIRDGLCSLIAEVIFLRDPYHPTLFHPRVAFHNTNSYLNLKADIRYALDELYIDFFYHRHEDFWREQALWLLPAIMNATDMLICGEDLGMVPECVPVVMRNLGILSLEIQRMPKDPKVEFAHPADAPYLSVCSTSTHDMSTLRGWWEEDRLHSERFFRLVMGQKGEFPQFMEPWVARDILNMHLYSPAMWAIFPVQDLLAMDGRLRWDNTEGERINVPAIAQHYWRYRMHLKLEELISEKKLNAELLSMISASGRGSNS
ncbi:MAG: 4-alpha-glucanotransferase [Bacteroidia bacterium]|nr:4-alpha-glucanotransferase [Bacteroidia bacterium]